MKTTYHGVTADDILVYAKRIITEFGWQRMAWPAHGPCPRSIRAALAAATEDLMLPHTSDVHSEAIRRVSEAIYGRGSVGGINDWEHRKDTNKDAVIAMLQRAIEMGPWPAENANSGVWPT
jgi:hypothetical protein